MIKLEEKDLKQSLFFAVREGKLEEATELINRLGITDFTSWEEGYVLLCDALKNQDTAMAKQLLDSGSRVNSGSGSLSETPLHLALLNGLDELVEHILEKGAQVGILMKDKNPPLHWAIENHQRKAVELLLKHGADADFENQETGLTPLQCAIQTEQKEIIELLVNEKADINRCSKKTGSNPLHLAIETGEIRIIELLLDLGADIEFEVGEIGRFHTIFQISGETAENFHREREEWEEEFCYEHEELDGLDFWVDEVSNCYHPPSGTCPVHRSYELDTVKAHKSPLQDRRNNLKDFEKQFSTPLRIALMLGKEKVVKLLLERGAQVDCPAFPTGTALCVAVENGDLKTVELVLEHSPNINNANNKNSLEIAVLARTEEHKKIAVALLEYGFTVDPRSLNIRHLVHVAAREGYLKLLQDLLECGVDVNNLLDEGFWRKNCTPLHMAAGDGQEEVVKLLIKYGANIKDEDFKGQTPIFYATEKNNAEMFNLLVAHGAKVEGNTELLITAVKWRSKEILEILLEYVDVNGTDVDGKTPLLYIYEHTCVCDKSARDDGPIINENTEITRFLLQKGANVNAAQKDGTTALHIAAKHGFTAIAKLLLEKGADPDAKMSTFITPLLLAAEEGHQDITETLLEFGADVNARDEYGSTALHISSEKGHVEVFASLLEHGANTNVRNRLNRKGLECPMSASISHWNPDDGICSCKPSSKIPSAILAEYRRRHYAAEIQFLTEVSLMKTEKIKNSDILFYDILGNDPSLLKVNRRYVDVLKATKSGYYKSQFPIHGRLIRAHLKKSLVMKHFFDDANHFLLNTLPELPVLCFEKIVSYLSNEDLMILSVFM